MQLLALQIFTLYILYILAETFAVCFRVCNSRIDNPLKYTRPLLIHDFYVPVSLSVNRLRIEDIKEVITFRSNNLDWGPVPLFAPWKHCSQCGLLYDSPFSKRSYFGRQESLASTSLEARGGNMGGKWCLGYAPRVLLHAANLRHGTDNFTSLPKEGVLRIFIAL